MNPYQPPVTNYAPASLLRWDACGFIDSTRHSPTKVKPGRAGLVLGWVTASAGSFCIHRTISAKNQSCVSTFDVFKQPDESSV